jgi:hypothetical protein
MTSSPVNRLVRALISFGEALISGIIVGALLAVLCALYVLSDAGDSLSVDGQLQTSSLSMFSGSF